MKPIWGKRLRDEERGEHGRRREGDCEFATYLKMNERDCRRRRCTAIGHRLSVSTTSPLEVGFRFDPRSCVRYNHRYTKSEPTNHIIPCLFLCDYDYVVSSVPIEHKHVGPIVPQTNCLRLPNELPNVRKCSDYAS